MVSVRTVRRFILGCQGLWPGRRSAGRPGTRQALHQSGLVQVDPLNVVGRSHDLALHARVWDYRPEHLDHLLYTSREFFDYGGTLYVLPMGEFPYWRVHMARRAAEEKPRAFAAEHKQLLASLREATASSAGRTCGSIGPPARWLSRICGWSARLPRGMPISCGRIGPGLCRLAAWVGGDYVQIEATSPARLRAPLARLVLDRP